MGITSLVTLLAFADAAPVKEDVAQVSEDNEVAEHRGRSLFPILIKCAFHGCSATGPRARSAARSPSGKEIVMSASEANIVKGPVKALEMLALNDDLNTVVMSNDMCTRRNAMARAAGLAAGLALSAVNAPGFAAETKMVKMGSDSGQLVFVPDEIPARERAAWLLLKSKTLKE